MLFILILGLYLFWVGWTALCLANNYRRARKLGFPIVLLPISSMNILWIVIQPAVISLVERIFGTSSFTRFAPRDWHFREKAYPHIEFGDAWALVTPGQIWFNVADPDAITDIFQRRTQFIRPVELYQMLKLFGRNASTVSWTEWKQHRKIISAPFNELANGIAWTEALNQTRDMLNIWTQAGGNGRFGLQQSTRTVALNVLAATGFGRTNKFNESHASSGDEESGYRTALSTLIDNALFMQLMPQRVLRSRFVPSSWVKLGHAADVFKKYMLDLLDQEKRLLYAGKPGASHLTSSLLRASEEYSSEKPDKPTRSMVKGLTISELLGNIYLINIAGHDTTANSLAYAIIHLAMNPEVQEWLSEEIHTVMGNNPTETWEYEATFKNLKRPLAVMVRARLHRNNRVLNISSMKPYDCSLQFWQCQNTRALGHRI
jgi:cytochrome P450